MWDIGRQWIRALVRSERVITCGEVFQLRLPLPDVGSMKGRRQRGVPVWDPRRRLDGRDG